MTHRQKFPTALRRLSALAVLAVLATGCASAEKTSSSSSSSAASKTSGSSSMAGMNMGSGTGTSGRGMSVGGITPIPTETLGQTSWQGMKIMARATTAVPFVIYDGSAERMVKPTKHTSFHLMVMLSDAHTGVPIPYATVWATIAKAGKVVYDERQWPMISRYMGPHYGNDVTLPGAGRYRMSLLVSPPVSARHVEYQHVWLKPHRVNLTFSWKRPA